MEPRHGMELMVGSTRGRRQAVAWRARALIACAAAALAGTGIAPSAAFASGTSPGGGPSGQTPSPAGTPAILLKVVQLKGGDVASTWHAHGMTAVAAGAPGTTVSITRAGQTGAVVSETPPAALVEASKNPTALARSYAASGRSVYYDAIGVGMTPAQAAQMAKAQGVPVPASASGSVVQTAMSGGTQVAVVTPAIFNSSCSKVYGDYGSYFPYVVGRACITQTYAGNGYVINKITSSAVDYGSGGGSNLYPDLTAYYPWSYYTYPGSSGTHTRVQWAPHSTIPEGVPTTVMLSVAYNGTGASMSTLVYPASLGPYFPGGPDFGGFWSGAVSGKYVSADSIDEVVDSPGATTVAGVSQGVSW